jgi:hypothetical protein
MCAGWRSESWAENFIPTAQEWSALAKRGGDPVRLKRNGWAILDASPIFVAAFFFFGLLPACRTTSWLADTLRNGV